MSSSKEETTPDFSHFDSWSVREIRKSATRFHEMILEKPHPGFYKYMVSVVGSNDTPKCQQPWCYTPRICITGIFTDDEYIYFRTFTKTEIDALWTYCYYRLNDKRMAA